MLCHSGTYQESEECGQDDGEKRMEREKDRSLPEDKCLDLA